MSSNQTDIRKVKKSGLIGSAILFVVASLHLIKGHSRFYILLYTLSAIIFIMAGFFTPTFKKATHAIGETLTWFMLAIVFYLVITPLGLIMRILGKDPLDKRIDIKANTYWLKKGKVETGYERQF